MELVLVLERFVVGRCAEILLGLTAQTPVSPRENVSLAWGAGFLTAKERGVAAIRKEFGLEEKP
jgi:hypothetical protein